MILARVVFTQCQRVTDGQRDRRTYGRTDGMPIVAIVQGLHSRAMLTPCKNDCHQWLSCSFRVHQIRFRPGLRPETRWGSGLPSWFKGDLLLMGGEGRGKRKGGRGKEGERRGRGVGGEGRKGEGTPP